mmetsp:Transcript_30623/g.29243  ORF Transcript_30623/g.29243 Transcript_30623/m.29243 type:complete len:243 (+) Transcript_30623:118-846(+)|eukprot:CAMPEP_0119041408 /NCGR_PEP_ID=MMETSP1177-20130426/11906_1 /TAXON_ID=2985 /ORGANISM="Ochromonas sp, Strain CCMP1899" /LENGTH=242 /DNA_ID=CAMNT_0007007427 /DNA_START=86 /DNA_END=814 /DNA_ORIENTATION=+
MSVQFEEAVETLEGMFPEWDKDTLVMMLEENGNHVERTIDSIFAMEGGGDQDTSSISHAGVIENEYLGDKENTGEKGRGKRCNLPENFLKAPHGYKESGDTFGDEQLALLMQNEMFQREINKNLGKDYMRRSQDSRRTPSNANGMLDQDLGILKGLSSMSSVAKRNLSSLASQFRNRNQQVGHDGEGERTRLVADEDGFTRSPFRDNEADEDEVITFSNNPSLDKSRGGHTLDDQYAGKKQI